MFALYCLLAVFSRAFAIVYMQKLTVSCYIVNMQSFLSAHLYTYVFLSERRTCKL